MSTLKMEQPYSYVLSPGRLHQTANQKLSKWGQEIMVHTYAFISPKSET